MCAVIGFYSPSPDEKAIKTLHRVFVESKIRGMHAYGYAKIENGQKKVNKSNQLGAILKELGKPELLIGHCRYSTSGDYKDHQNNQPLEHQGENMVFNGVIDMATKPEMEQAYGIKMSCDNDGEIMLQSGERMEMLKGNISYAGGFLKDNQITFMRNLNRPAYIGRKHDAIYVGSTFDILRRALILDIEEMTPFQEHSWKL